MRNGKEDIEMANRNYFTRPTQAGGRTVHDYGHTKLGYPEVGHELRWWHYVAMFAFFMWMLSYV